MGDLTHLSPEPDLAHHNQVTGDRPSRLGGGQCHAHGQVRSRVVHLHAADDRHVDLVVPEPQACTPVQNGEE